MTEPVRQQQSVPEAALLHRDDHVLNWLTAHVLRPVSNSTPDELHVAARPCRLGRLPLESQRHLRWGQRDDDLVVIVLGTGRLLERGGRGHTVGGGAGPLGKHLRVHTFP